MNLLEHKTKKIDGKTISVSVPSRKITWNEFVKETSLIVKKWVERSK